MRTFTYGSREQLAVLISDLVLKGTNIKEKITSFRANFTDIRYCFTGDDYAEVMQKLYQLI